MRVRVRTAALVAGLLAADRLPAQTPVAPPPRPVAAATPDRSQFQLTALVLQVDAEFLAASGLARPGSQERTWVLDERGRERFNLALREHPNRELWSRPQVQVTDGQTGHIRVGQEVPAGPGVNPRTVPAGFTARITPRLSADGKATVLRVDSQLTTVNTTPAAGVTAFPRNIQTMQTTVRVPTGSTTVLSLPTLGDDGKPVTVLLLVTPRVER